MREDHPIFDQPSMWDFEAGQYVSSTEKMKDFQNARFFVSQAKVKHYLDRSNDIECPRDHVDIVTVEVAEPE
jgi:hypothetical protein